VKVAIEVDHTSASVIASLGFAEDMAKLRHRIADWVERCDPEMRDALEWQFLAGSKYFRPLTIFACHRSTIPGPIPEPIMTSALVIELFHNVSLIIDDILDRSDTRRGRATLHIHFGNSMH
jgi:geranylgeranyl diphosphate synthase, type I